MMTTILIIDDNIELLDLLEEVLEKEYKIERAFSVEQALGILDKVSVQLVISDVMMPEINGFEFCNKFKTDPRFYYIPVILLTAKNTMVSMIEGLERGADAYISKPFSPRHLKAQIKNLITNRIKIKEHFASSPFIQISSIAENKEDAAFLEELNEVVIQNIDNPQLGIDFLARELKVSRSSLYRKIKGISNLTIHEIINVTRLKRAAALLAEGKYRIFEVSNILGYSSPNHFNRVFFKQFNMSPTAFVKSIVSDRARFGDIGDFSDKKP